MQSGLGCFADNLEYQRELEEGQKDRGVFVTDEGEVEEGKFGDRRDSELELGEEEYELLEMQHCSIFNPSGLQSMRSEAGNA